MGARVESVTLARLVVKVAWTSTFLDSTYVDQLIPAARLFSRKLQVERGEDGGNVNE